jgi:phospholipase C
VTWGWFHGGFADCNASHRNIGGDEVVDYIPHHEPFQYWPQTANPRHLPPRSPRTVGRDDRANHQYDIKDFWRAADAGTVPAVSFFKPPGYQDAHAGYSDPVDEQHYLVSVINRLQRLPQWKRMAILIAYDDAGGWYDHELGPIVSPSADAAVDSLSAPGECGTPAAGAYPGRCGYGLRVPVIVISPYARPGTILGQLLDQTSILRFIEDNWRLGRLGNQSLDAIAGDLRQLFDFSGDQKVGRLFLNPRTGRPD